MKSKKYLVFVGGGHAHLTCLRRIGHFVRRGHHVTLISPSPYHYYSGMGSGMLSGVYQREEIRFNIKQMAEESGGSFVQGTVTRVYPSSRLLLLDSGEEVNYDVVSFNTGSSVAVNRVAVKTEENVFTAKPIENLVKARQSILDLIKNSKPQILVVGGGPTGLELAGNTWRLVQDHRGEAHITLLAGSKLLSGFPAKVRDLAYQSLKARGIEVVEGSHLKHLESGQAIMEDGHNYPFDLVFLALGVRASKLFRDSELPTGEDDGLMVNSYLQSVEHPEIFGGGDCISFQDRPLDKVGVYAVRENPILYDNLMAALEGGSLQPFHPQEAYLLIFNLGDGKGIFWRRNWVFNGRLAFFIKDYIDRKFMRKFQI